MGGAAAAADGVVVVAAVVVVVGRRQFRQTILRGNSGQRRWRSENIGTVNEENTDVALEKIFTKLTFLAVLLQFCAKQSEHR